MTTSLTAAQARRVKRPAGESRTAKSSTMRPLDLEEIKLRRAELARELRAYQVTPHIARKVHSAIDRRTTRHLGYAISQIKRKGVEEIFGWMKTIGGLRKTPGIVESPESVGLSPSQPPLTTW